MRAREVIRAYHDVGMRVSYSYSMRDQNRLVYQADAEFVASLPQELHGPMQRWYDRFHLSPRRLLRRCSSPPRAASNQEPGEDPARAGQPALVLGQGADARWPTTSRKYNVPMHMHLVETAYQKEYARRRGGCTAVEYIDRFGLLGPQLTLGHGVWLNEADIDRWPATGTCICHNCSSNFRLRSGVAALNVFEAKGINTAIGLDEAGINDDRDMLQEMRWCCARIACRAWRTTCRPGAGAAHGDRRRREDHAVRRASWARWRSGKAADMVLIDWDRSAYPYLDAADADCSTRCMQRAKSAGRHHDDVRRRGDLRRTASSPRSIGRRAARRCTTTCSKALADDEVERRKLSKALLPHVKAFYANYFDPSAHEPFYRPSSRI